METEELMALVLIMGAQKAEKAQKEEKEKEDPKEDKRAENSDEAEVAAEEDADVVLEQMATSYAGIAEVGGIAAASVRVAEKGTQARAAKEATET